ncbi:LytR C-terminal domain-containing protein [Bifidobacterium choloepi]|uniref:LytR family transcriptional regulator n=1 Tax=Bifidobacterium choloepi TaxID=2614131 RepID=A0A6I5NG70_9BIFI|nr:LytR C-terminal domain-containing protein [Bifidobacterium choloepi]NEG69373.1 LytR family transcriptional regulator [Bifidobacterium choloepi]
MAHDKKDSKGYDSYPKDSYDNPPAGPVGVHRGARSAAARTAPFIAVLVIAVLAALIFWGVFSGEAANMFKSSSEASSGTTTSATSTASSSSASASASDTASASSSASASATDESSASATDESSASASASDESSATDTAGTVDYGTQISVINATGVQGYASQEATKLNNAGFTAVTAANPSSNATLPDATVVWYASDDDLATAQQVASTLGISNVVQANISVPVMVVLMS